MPEITSINELIVDALRAAESALEPHVNYDNDDEESIERYALEKVSTVLDKIFAARNGGGL